VTDFTGDVTVALGSNNPTGGTLSGDTTVAAINGIATFTSLSIDLAERGYTFVATAAGLPGATSVAFDVTPGLATEHVFTVQPSGATAGAAIRPVVQVTVRDALGNTATDFNGNVTVALAANPTGDTLSGTKTVAAVAGVATFSDLSISKVGNGYTLVARVAGLADVTSTAFSIAPGEATKLVFTGQPTTTTAGANIRVRVTAKDAFDNTAPGFNGNVTVAIGTNPAGGVLGGTKTFAAIAGVATFSTLDIDNVGQGYTLTASATGLFEGTSASFDIIPSTPTHLIFTVQRGEAGPATAGATLSPALVVTARDSSGQTAASFTGSVTLSITPGTGAPGATLRGDATVAAVAGVATFPTLSIDKVGFYKLTATASGLPPVTSGFFTIVAGPMSRLVFTLQPSTTTAGAAITPQVEVTARDSFDNTADRFTGDVTVALATNPGGGTLSGTTTVAAVDGIAMFRDLRIDQPESGYVLSATHIAPGAAAQEATSLPFDITAARATQLVFTVQPTSTKAGVAISPALQVMARDASGQRDTSFRGNVTLSITAGTGTAGAILFGDTTVAAVNGVATFSGLSIVKSGSGYKLSATATGLSGSTSASFTINPGAPTQLRFSVQPDSTPAAAAITPPVQVSVLDSLGNPVRTFTGDVTIAIWINPGGGTLSGATTVPAVAGVATFHDLSIDRSGVGYRLVATVSGLTDATSDAFTITAGPATHLLFLVQPSNTTAGAAIRPVVRVAAFDALGNPASGFTGEVTLAITAGTGNGSAALLGGKATAVNGVAVFSSLGIDQAGTGYRLTATAAGLTGVTSAAFDIN
jgi:hypothetical protein